MLLFIFLSSDKLHLILRYRYKVALRNSFETWLPVLGEALLPKEVINEKQ
jgi:hypothetical protein